MTKEQVEKAAEEYSKLVNSPFHEGVKRDFLAGYALAEKRIEELEKARREDFEDYEKRCVALIKMHQGLEERAVREAVCAAYGEASAMLVREQDSLPPLVFDHMLAQLNTLHAKAREGADE